MPGEKLADIFSTVIEGASISSQAVIRLCRDGSTGKHILSANPIYDDEKVVGKGGCQFRYNETDKLSIEGFFLDITRLDEILWFDQT